MNVYNKLEWLSLTSLSSKGKAYQSEAAFKCSSPDRLLALPTNIKLGQKGLKGEHPSL
jgi:hypothetical protein